MNFTFKKYSSINRTTSQHNEGELSKTADYFLGKDNGWYKKPNNGEIVSYKDRENMTKEQIEALNLEKISETKCAWFQKVHGANFGVYLNDKGDFKFASRNNFITEADNFYSNRWIALVEELKPKLIKIYESVKNMFPDTVQVSFYGELAGGHYDGEGEGVVQSKTHYCKNQFLYFFDIYRFFEVEAEINGVVSTVIENKVINPLTSVKLFEENDVFHAKILKQGTLKELFNTEKDYTNHVSLELEGGQVIESEGLVIKSIEDDKLYFGETRILLKDINPKFTETNKSKRNNKKAPKKSKSLTVEGLKYLDAAYTHVTDMRLDKVCGNLGYSRSNFEGRFFSEVVNAMLDDVIKEMADEGFETPVVDLKAIRGRLASEINLMVRKKLL